MLIHPTAVAWLRNSLIASLVLGVIWAVGASAAGYQLGYPPSPCNAQTLRIDLIIPMWKSDDNCVTVTYGPVNP